LVEPRATRWLGRALDVLLLAYLLAMFGDAFYAIVSYGALRIVWFPIVNASAYTVTVLIYCVVGLWLFSRFRWKAAVPLGLIGIFQEGTWNLGYITLYPNFPSIQTVFWEEYVVAIIVATPVFLFLQRRWFESRLSWNPLALIFPAYFAIYYLLGMPTYDYVPNAAHTNTVGFEVLYVLACMVFYLALLKLDLRVGSPPESSAMTNTVSSKKRI
jgi:hypothetical protein